MLKYVLLVAMLMAQVAFAQKRVAILNTEDDGVPPLKTNELSFLTDKLRDIAVKTLPKASYDIMTTQTIYSFLGSQKEVEKVCEEANGCLAKVGQSIDADYIGQARLNRFGKLYTIKMEIYDVRKGTLVGTFTDGSSKDISNLLTIIDNKAPEIFKEVSGVAPAATIQTTAAVTTAAFKTVKIGNQVWMAENLNIDVPGSKCYDNKPVNCAKYGRLYDWEAAMKACPKGWHLPTKAEWEVMTNYIGGAGTEGTYLKAKSGWNNNGMDKFGFTALPGGYGYLYLGSLSYIDMYGGHWWSASEHSANNAYNRYIGHGNKHALWNNDAKTYLFSVRCLQD